MTIEEARKFKFSPENQKIIDELRKGRESLQESLGYYDNAIAIMQKEKAKEQPPLP